MIQEKNKQKINKNIFYAICVFIIILLISIYGGSLFQKIHFQTIKMFTDDSIVKIADIPIRVELANTPQKRMIGLSGKESLAKNSGMLFEFEKNDRHGFWMKDMNFAIDIIWINESKEIIYIQENAKPESYPEVFLPPTPNRYVLEVKAGFAEEQGVKIGDTVVFY